MPYFEIAVGLLFVLALVDLSVGVSNDAVNFLNSAIGSRVATRRVILIIAGLGVLAGSSVYAFVVMLAAFLIGITLGSAAAAAFGDRVRSPASALAVVLAGLAVAVGFVLRVADPSGWSATGRIGGSIAGFAGLDYGFELGGYLLTLLPAATLLGAAVPLVARAAGAGRGRGGPGPDI